jgi:hypothetical protein
MPNRKRKPQKTVAGKARGVSRRSTLRRPRKINFQNESWYAATARRMSASRSAPEPIVEATPQAE